MSNFALDSISASHTQPGGYRTYALNLISHLHEIDRVNDYLLLVDRPVSWHMRPNWRAVILSSGPGVGVVWREQILLPRYIKHQKADLLHSLSATAPLRTSLPLIVTIYDTIEFSDPLPPPGNAKRWAMRVYSRAIQKRAARNALRVITISEYSRTNIIKLMGVESEKVITIHLAPRGQFLPIVQSLSNKKNLPSRLIVPQDFILAIASFAPRKNIDRLIKAYSELPNTIREKNPLVLVCTHANVKERIEQQAERLNIQNNLCLYENVSDQDLFTLYNRARLFVFPSLDEGFGLPPLEAMACGTPVIASNTSSLPEILGDAALLIPPLEREAITEAIHKVLMSKGMRNTLRQRGFLQSRKYSWEHTAQATLDVYNNVLNIMNEPGKHERGTNTLPD